MQNFRAHLRRGETSPCARRDSLDYDGHMGSQALRVAFRACASRGPCADMWSGALFGWSVVLSMARRKVTLQLAKVFNIAKGLIVFLSPFVGYEPLRVR